MTSGVLAVVGLISVVAPAEIEVPFLDEVEFRLCVASYSQKECEAFGAAWVGGDSYTEGYCDCADGVPADDTPADWDTFGDSSTRDALIERLSTAVELLRYDARVARDADDFAAQKEVARKASRVKRVARVVQVLLPPSQASTSASRARAPVPPPSVLRDRIQQQALDTFIEVSESIGSGSGC